MPLKKKGENCVSKNISELHHSGKKERSDEQIVAIAHAACGKSKGKPSSKKKAAKGRKSNHVKKRKR